MSGGGGPSAGPSTSTTTTNLPKWLRPYAKDFIGAYGRQVFGPDYVPGGPADPMAMPGDLQQQIAGFTPDQLAAMEGMRGITGDAQDLANLGGRNVTDTLSGAYLDPTTNPWLSKTFDVASQDMVNKYQLATAPGTMAAAQRAGQFGSSAMNELMAYDQYNLGENLNNLATSIYGGNYAQERQNQLATMGMLPQVISNMYDPYRNLYGVGAMEQEQEQFGYDVDYQNAVGRAEWPFNLLSGMGGALGQAGSGAGTSTTRMTGGASGGGGTVICTELYRQGLMDAATYAADSKYGERLPPEVIAGYHRWGIPVANAMRRSRLITKLVAPLALAWAREMRAEIEGRDRRPGIGRLLLIVGVPICAWLGRKTLRMKEAI